jgi:DNA-binding MarR family transcriptional regulator
MNREEEDILGDVSRAYMMVRRRFDKAMSEQGASLAQTRILMSISAENGIICATDLAERFSVAPRTVTEALDVLERDGLVSRVADPSDRRVKRLSITAAGAAAVGATEPFRRQLTTQILSRLSGNERKTLHALLQKLLHALSD